MVKLKKYRVHKMFCPNCKGNGYVKVMKEDLEPHVHQCWECDSEGEFYVYQPKTLISDNDVDSVTGNDNKLQ